MYVVDDCDPRIFGNNVWSLEQEMAMLFDVHTCSRVRVQLNNGPIQLVYQLEFANSDAGVNTISILGTGEETNENVQFSQDCANIRQLWVLWKDGFISAGIGLSPGTMMQVMRLAARREGSNKAIGMDDHSAL